jgi:SAM-dependent methyltransferase
MIVDLTYGKNGAMGRELGIVPDICNNWNLGGFNFEQIPYPDNSIDTILFDPPFIPWGPSKSVSKEALVFWESFGYYKNIAAMRDSLSKAFSEIYRVLKPNGICIFKWGNTGKSLDWTSQFWGKLSKREIRIRAGKGSSGKDKTRPKRETYFVWLCKQSQTEVSL